MASVKISPSLPEMKRENVWTRELKAHFQDTKNHMSIRFFSSESVTEGHPDKMADQISDAVLDAILKDDKNARVACETFLTTGIVVVGGEIST